MADSNASSGGIGFCGLLAIVFITLKLLGKITWGWLWVLSPLWIPIGIGALVMAIAFLFAGAAWAYMEIKGWK
jgi:hypothetical protein